MSHGALSSAYTASQPATASRTKGFLIGRRIPAALVTNRLED
jgi:hypothetical protein